MAAPATSMHPREFHALRGILYRRTGIFLPESRAALVESRLAPRINELELESFDQYIRFLSFATHQADELQELLERLDGDDAHFFRYPRQLEFFEAVALPALLDRCATDRHLRIWCPGCGNGEEPFTVAMIVRHVLGDALPDWAIEILGTDLSRKRIDRAATGEYDRGSLRATPSEVRDNHFIRRGDTWALDPLVASMVTFALHNPTSVLGARRLGVWDAIVCRTTLASFDPAARARITGIFHDHLAPAGYLLVGPGDVTRECDGLLTRVAPPDVHAFTK